jgi:hypothetical protein
MNLVLEIGPEAQKTIEEAFGGDLSRAAVEALAAEGYRSGRLTRFQVQQVLGLRDRWETEAWLKGHGAAPEVTVEEVVHDFEASRAAREGGCSSLPTPRR